MKVGILFGGKSFEHDISIITCSIIYHSLKEKHDIYLIYLDKDGMIRFSKDMDLENFKNYLKLRKINFIYKGISFKYKKIKLDVIINAMHGINGEDGLAHSISKIYDIPFVGSNNISSAVLMDKYFTYALLKSNNIKTIPTKFVFKDDELLIEDFPVIVKPARLGSSIGIKVINNKEELSGLKDAFLFDDKVVVQPFFTDFREFNQAAYLYKGDIILSNVEEVFHKSEYLSFEDKYTDSKVNRKHILAIDKKLIERISDITKKVYKIFELSGVIRVDYMMVNGRILLNEINTTPGSFAYYLFETEISELLSRLIYEGLKVYQNQKKTVFESSVLDQDYNYKK